MSQDPRVRDEAVGVLSGLFRHLGSGGTQPAPAGLNLGALGTQFEQLVEMPVELANVFLNMSVQLTELILRSLEEAGIVLARGLSPV
jgi:hypothetical protein